VGFLVAAALTPAARAQGLSRPGFVPVPAFAFVRMQTTVTVPDGGTVSLGGYSQLSEGRNEFGVSGPGRGFRNVGYGRTAASGRVTASVRIIDLREEEYRQTVVRSR
jgi:general secretion pathway protein D